MLSEATKNMVHEHVEEHLYFVDCDIKVGFTQLFDRHLLDATTELEHRYLFKRALDHLIACGEVDVMFAGENDEGETLYIRTA